MSATETPDAPQEQNNSYLTDLIRQLPAGQQAAFHRAMLECADELKQDALVLVAIIQDSESLPGDRGRAMHTLLDQFHLLPDEEGRYGMDLVASESGAAARHPPLQAEVQRMDLQEAQFADCLRQLMKERHISQRQLADRLGCTQPAISQMLNRQCRPQRKTLEKLASALDVTLQQLWPDIDVSDYLDAVAGFSRDEQVMTEEMAETLRQAPENDFANDAERLPSWKARQQSGG